MQDETHARTSVTEVTLPASLTTPLPEDASPLDVAARTAATTALGVDGVHHLGGLLDRAADQLRSRLGRSASAPGVQVDDTDGTLDVRVSLVVTYPEHVTAVADEVRAQVGHALGQLATLPVRVDVRVTDVHGPFDDAPADS
ncbi:MULTISPECIES: Asp23/Gls24 family envelope stress response protein [unclassified Curtobacterium]|uniref:Asp23/Gls24 family envelope stress response protein n=1 Tax=unclassified Curtobacterium TaxID=257496 RepID=UPI00381AF977